MSSQMRFPFAALFAVVFLFMQTVLHAGAWTQKRGHFFTKFGILRFESTSQYLLNRDREPLQNNGRVTDFTVYNYLEYGLFDDLTLIANIPAKRAKFSCAVEDCGDVSSGLADVIFGMRYKLSEGAWIVSIQSDVKIAANYEKDEDKLGNAPPLGDGQTDFDFILLAGRSLFDYRGYINLEAGYRGLRAYEAIRILQGLRGRNIIGADIVCPMPTVDSPNQITALTGSVLLFEMLCLIADYLHS